MPAILPVPLVGQPRPPDAAPEPVTQSDDRALRLTRLESFYDGLDTVDQKLDQTSRDTFAQMLAATDNPQEARASAVNKAYVAYTQPQAREAIEGQWPFVRQQVARSLGINKPEVSDTDLYGAIGQHVKDARERRTLAHDLIHEVYTAAMEGESDWRKPYAAFLQANKQPGAPLAHMDDFRQMAEAAAAQFSGKAATIGPAVKAVSTSLAAIKADPSPMRNDLKDREQDAIVAALMPLAPADRTLAIQLAARKAAKETPETDRGALEKGGESISRGVQGLTLGLENVLRDLFTGSVEGESVRPEILARNQIMRELHTAYFGTVDPVKADSAAAQGLLNLTGMLPQLGLIAQPWVGVPLLLASNTDARQGQLQAEGVPVEQARAVGLAQGTVDTALAFVSSNMVLGKTGALMTPAKTISGALLKNLTAETAVMAGVTVAQAAGPLAVQEIASRLSEAVPGVDYQKEFEAFKHALPETIATLTPMILLGTGAATFRDVTRMRDYTANETMLRAVGFSEERAGELAAIGDPAARVDAIRAAWGERAAGSAAQQEAIAELESARGENPGVTIAHEADGSYTVRGPEGAELPGITDPAEAQRQADNLADRQSDPAKALASLADAIKAEPAGEAPSAFDAAVSEARKTGIAAPMPDWLRPTAARIREIGAEIASLPKFTAFKQALNRWVGRGQIASLEIRQTARQIQRAVPDRVARDGITAWLQAAGDRPTLEHWAKTSTNLAYKRGYEAALKLTPEQIRVAEHLRDFYEKMLVELQAHGLVDHGVENYVSQIWQKESPVTGKDVNPVGPKLVTDLKHAKERTFGSYFEGEMLGYKPVTKDISKLVALYANSVSKVLATREFIKELTTKKASDGRPLAAPFGNRALTTAAEGEPVYIKPLAKDGDTLDYRTIEGQPALTKWKWIGEHNGADAYLEGQLGLHPEIFTHVRNALGRSVIREWYGERSGPLMQTVKDTVRLIDKIGQVTKGTMLGFFSPFHVVQEGTHAIGHKINPFSHLPDLDPAAPLVRNAVEHGLMLAGDGEAMRQFKDAIDANLTNHIPVIGEYAQKFTEWMFHDYIPQLKLKTYEAIRERNAERYKDELAAKTTTHGEIDYLSAQQTNAAYGHLNYADLNRNPTLQHIAQVLLLAPDFLEARGRFAGQAFKGVASKAGREQLVALATLALTQWGTARIMNKLLDDDWHNDSPFDVVAGNRRYTMRSVPEDMFKLVADPRRFAMGRISPLIGRGIFQLGTGKNWRGEKVDYSDTFKELATAWVPIALRATPLGRELTFTDKANPISPWEQFLGSVGIHISRNSPIAKAHELATEWNKALPEGDPAKRKEDKGVYPVSKYQALRYALEDGDADRAAEALTKLREGGAKKIGEGFHESLFNPWTDSRVRDAKFKAALAPEELALVEHAEAMRQAIWQRFNLLLQRMTSSANNN